MIGIAVDMLSSPRCKVPQFKVSGFLCIYCPYTLIERVF